METCLDCGNFSESHVMKKWTLNDIAWNRFEANKARPDLVSLAKAASMVEFNGADYARYLCEVFHEDAEFKTLAEDWAVEEIQHGAALRRWAELADPSFNFDKSFKMFAEGYKLPQNVKQSVRGSRTGELIARCVVETGTSGYYAAIAESTDEPVLKEICLHIAADELRHYKLFYTYLKQYLVKENVSKAKRLSIAWGRIAESEDDELAYAFFAAHGGKGDYDRKTCMQHYLSLVYPLYRRHHVQRMIAMTFKAVGLKPQSRLAKVADFAAWRAMQWRNKRLKSVRPDFAESAAIERIAA